MAINNDSVKSAVKSAISSAMYSAYGAVADPEGTNPGLYDDFAEIISANLIDAILDEIKFHGEVSGTTAPSGETVTGTVS